MAELNEKQTELIENTLLEKGIELYALRQSLLDHICCAIEKKLESGISFQTAFDDVFHAFGDHGLQHIQTETLELLHPIESPMKQTSFISGIIAGALICIGTYFKINWWAGANVLTIGGLFVFLFAFLPSIFLTQFRKETQIAGKLSHVAGLISIIVFTLGGFVFRFLNWPGANMLMYLGAGGGILIYLPLLMYKNTLDKSTQAQNKYVLVIFILCIAGIMFTSLKGPGHSTVKGYVSINQNMENTYKDLLLKEKELSGTGTIQTPVKKESDKLILEIEKLKYELIQYSPLHDPKWTPTHPLETCNDMFNETSIYEIILQESQPRAKELYTLLKKSFPEMYPAYENFVEENFNHKSLVVVYTNLNILKNKIKQQQIFSMLHS